MTEHDNARKTNHQRTRIRPNCPPLAYKPRRWASVSPPSQRGLAARSYGVLQPPTPIAEGLAPRSATDAGLGSEGRVDGFGPVATPSAPQPVASPEPTAWPNPTPSHQDISPLDQRLGRTYGCDDQSRNGLSLALRLHSDGGCSPLWIRTVFLRTSALHSERRQHARPMDTSSDRSQPGDSRQLVKCLPINRRGRNRFLKILL